MLTTRRGKREPTRLRQGKRGGARGGKVSSQVRKEGGIFFSGEKKKRAILLTTRGRPIIRERGKKKKGEYHSCFRGKRSAFVLNGKSRRRKNASTRREGGLSTISVKGGKDFGKMRKVLFR